MSETNFNHDLYKGHVIFRNQLPYTAFSSSFDNVKDAFFQRLNEIDSEFVTKEKLSDNNGFERDIVIDPRTKEEVHQTERDFTLPKCTKVFDCNYSSVLTRAQQEACLRVMHGRLQGEPLNEDDFDTWRKCNSLIMKEQQAMQKFVFDYAQREKIKIYSPMKKLVTLYKQWYQCEVNLLLQPETNISYATSVGLPHVRECTTLNDKTADIVDLKIISREGFAVLVEETLDVVPLASDIYRKLDEYANHIIPGKIHKLPQSIVTLQQTRFHLPLDSLLFLLTVGEYIDTPTEMLLDITQIDDKDSDGKFYSFHPPIPARNCGWHTNSKIVEAAFGVYISMSKKTKWVDLETQNIVIKEDSESEIDCSQKENVVYKLKKFDNYLMENAYGDKFEDFRKGNKVSIKWNLCSSDITEKSYEIHTIMEMASALDKSCSNYLGFRMFKIEYKSEFGSEIMSKYELLKAWLQITLLNAPFGICSRIASDSFDLLLEQQLTRNQLEQKLMEYYHVSIPILLGKLHEFFNLITRVTTGKYLLRFDPKYKKTVMLCAPSNQSKQEISIHSLLKTDPTDYHFMAQLNYLPIDINLCNRMHLEHKIIPCTFIPRETGRRGRETFKNIFESQSTYREKRKYRRRNRKESQIPENVPLIERIKIERKKLKLLNKKRRRAHNRSKQNKDQIQ